MENLGVDLRTSLLPSLEDKGGENLGEYGYHGGDDRVRENVVDDILKKHRRSTQEESKYLCFVLEAVLETLKQEDISPSATAVFASLMSFMGSDQGRESAVASAACCHALSLVVARVPMPVLRSKCVECATLVMGIIEKGNKDPLVLKTAIPCLGQFVAASGPRDWTAMTPVFRLVLSHLLDQHPKVRKKAQSAIVEIFAAFQNDACVGMLDHASGDVLELSTQVLSGPEHTAHAAAKASNKQRKKAEDDIRAAVSNALRLMGTLKQIVHLLSESCAQQLCSRVLSLYHLQQSLLASSATEILLAFCNAPSSRIDAKVLVELLQALLSINALWNSSDATLEMSAIQLLESLTVHIHQKGGDLGSLLSKVMHILVPQLASQAEGVARSAARSMESIIRETVTDALIKEALDNAGQQRAPLVSLVTAVESSFGVQYYDSWELSLSITQQLISKLGRTGSVLASGLLEKIGELCAGVEDVAAGESGESARIAEIAQNTLGICIRSLGPEIVLDHLPLDLEDALDGQTEGRTWMIPLLKIHMKGGRIAFWLSEIQPLISRIESRRFKAAKDSPHSRQVSTLYALELQLWSTLPSFSSWAEDVDETLPELTKTVGPYFEKRNDVRLYISQAIQSICVQTRRILSHYDLWSGFADPCTRSDFEDEDDTDDDLDDDSTYINKSTADNGEKRLKALKMQSKIWMPLLLNAFVSTHSSKRNHLQCAISSYACLCDENIANAVFKSAMTRLMKIANQIKTGELGKDAVLDGGDTDIERYCTYLEALYALLGGIDVNGLKLVYQLVLNGMQEKDPAVQKKAYKILHYIVADRSDFCGTEFETIIQNVLEGGATAISASRAFRIRCLKSIILHLLGDKGSDVDLSKIPFLDVEGTGMPSTDTVRLIIMPMVSEIVLSIKESNKKTRAAAFDLIIEVANAMNEKDPQGGVVSLVHLVLGGLVGSTSQMVSASVMALARILFEFTPIMIPMMDELLPAVIMLLRSKAREVIKSVLGFLKVAVMRLDSQTLLNYTPQILEGTLIWAEDSKNKFRLKVRVILERLAKKVGFEPLATCIPESHKSLLTHIRKQMSRKDRLKSAQSEMDWDGQSFADTLHSRGGRSKGNASNGPSAWQSDVFSDDSLGKKTNRAKSLLGLEKKKSSKVSFKSEPAKARNVSISESQDVLNLLDASTSRRMVGMNVRRSGYVEKEIREEDDVVFAQDKHGKLIISEEKKEKKRDRDEFLDGFDSDDSDIEDIKGIHGAHLALKGAQSIAKASSYAGTVRSAGGKSSMGRKNEKGSHHSGDRFKAKRKGTGGDVKGKGPVQPYAYWPLDRKMLNRREQKTKSAKQGLDKVVNAAKDGALKGRKAKRRRH